MIACIVCGAPTEIVIGYHRDYRLLQCPNCGLQFSDPMLGATANYAQAYDQNGAPAEVAGEGLPFLGWTEAASQGLVEFPAFLSTAQQFALELIQQRFPQHQRLPALDIGFGAGWFLGALRTQGLCPYGAEVADAPVDVLRKKGFVVCKSRDGQLPREWPSPVLITAFEVLEHLETPVDFLLQLRHRHPDADVLLSAPDERRWFLLGGREPHDYPPNHLTRWSGRALKLALERAGFRHARVWHLRPTAQELSMASVRRFLPWVDKNPTSAPRVQVPSTTLKQELRKRALRRKIFSPLALLLSLFGKTACSMLALGSNRLPTTLSS